MALVQRGQYADAVPLLQQAYAAHVQQQGERHPDTLRSQGELVAALVLVRPQEALPLAESLLRLRRETQGEKNPQALAAMESLGFVYYKLSRYEDELALDRQLLELRNQTLGEKHPQSLRTLRGVAIDYQNLNRQGRLPAAAGTGPATEQRSPGRAPRGLAAPAGRRRQCQPVPQPLCRGAALVCAQPRTEQCRVRRRRPAHPAGDEHGGHRLRLPRPRRPGPADPRALLPRATAAVGRKVARHHPYLGGAGTGLHQCRPRRRSSDAAAARAWRCAAKCSEETTARPSIFSTPWPRPMKPSASRPDALPLRRQSLALHLADAGADSFTAAESMSAPGADPAGPAAGPAGTGRGAGAAPPRPRCPGPQFRRQQPAPPCRSLIRLGRAYSAQQQLAAAALAKCRWSPACR